MCEVMTAYRRQMLAQYGVLFLPGNQAANLTSEQRDFTRCRQFIQGEPVAYSVDADDVAWRILSLAEMWAYRIQNTTEAWKLTSEAVY